jgi:uracil-DNA glycosylase family protein
MRDDRTRHEQQGGEMASMKPSAIAYVPSERSLEAARAAAAVCKGCPLWRGATQTVFGEGAPHAPLMLVGESPGDQEDLVGQPFVGPAGRLLDKALGAAGIDRADVYVTNAVKHFKWEPRGKRRLHKTPTPNEVSACLPWLKLEIELVKPVVLVCLGATASRALLGRSFRVSQERGRFVPSALAPLVTATIHPSALLRLRDEISREVETRHLIGDLELVRKALESQRAAR